MQGHDVVYANLAGAMAPQTRTILAAGGLSYRKDAPMTNHIAGKVVLIVDACSEAAAAAAHHLAEAGAILVLGAPDVDDVRELAPELRWNGGRALAVRACPWDIARMPDLLNEVVDMYGRVDVIVNNAGSMPTMQARRGLRPVATNITRAWYGTSAALPTCSCAGAGTSSTCRRWWTVAPKYMRCAP
jgi:NADP-dependent 3-hydroxy acid dehydrogenase YdfG